MSHSTLDDVLKRLERVEKEIEVLKQKQAPPSRKSEGPGPREREVIERVKKTLLDVYGEEDRLMTFLALERSPEAPGGWDSWSIISAGGPRPDVDIKRISELLESCSNEMRLKILYEVHKGPRYPKEITGLTGLSGGALYHHLDILTEAGLIERDSMKRIVRTADGELFCDLIFHLDRIGSRKEQKN